MVEKMSDIQILPCIKESIFVSDIILHGQGPRRFFVKGKYFQETLPKKGQKVPSLENVLD